MSKRMPGISMPKICLEMDRWPLLETGKNSVRPWMMPWMMASKILINSSFSMYRRWGPPSVLVRFLLFGRAIFALPAPVYHLLQAVDGVGKGAQRID